MRIKKDSDSIAVLQDLDNNNSLEIELMEGATYESLLDLLKSIPETVIGCVMLILLAYRN